MSLSEVVQFTPEYLKAILAAVLSIFLGLLLKLASEWEKDRLTWKRAFIQAMFSSGVGYIVFFWLDNTKFIGLRPEIWLCVCSFAAAHIIGAIDTVSKERTVDIIKDFADRIIAKKKTEDDDDPKV